MRLVTWCLASCIFVGACTDTVNFVEVAPSQLQINISGAPLQMGDTARVEGTVQDANARTLSGWDVRWSSSDSTIATVDEVSGQLVAVSAGTVTIRGTAGGQTSGTTLQVTWPSPEDTKPGTLSAGQVHACALDSRGYAYCWGINNFGQLGNNSTVGASRPVRVATNMRFRMIASGSVHTCGIGLDDGRVYCWGRAASGRLGDGVIDPTSVTTPQPISDQSSYLWVDAGGSHTCGITTDNVVKCWGPNGRGQLGSTTTQICNGTITCSPTPVAIQSSEHFRSIEVGTFHTCAITIGGDVYCWGNNEHGELGLGSSFSGGSCSDLGNNTPLCSDVPMKVTLPGGQTAAALSMGYTHACAIASGGILYCWGDNSSGQLGIGNTTNQSTPVRVRQGTTFVAAGGSHTCSVSGGPAYCWGRNAGGQLGDGGTTNSSSPVALERAWPTRLMTLGQSFTCSLNVAADLTAGGIFCWGANDSGQLGAESTENCGSSPCSTAPVAVTLAGAPAASSAPTRLVSAAMSLATFAGHVDPENTEPRAAAVKMERSGSRRPNRILSRQ